MRPVNHMPCSPDEATVAVLGEATFDRIHVHDDTWCDTGSKRTLYTDTLTRYGATFWKPVVPEPGYRLVEDHERVGEKPNGCVARSPENDVWVNSDGSEWLDEFAYAVPIKPKVVAWRDEDFNGEPTWCAWFDTEERRDCAVAEANERANGRERND